MPVREVTVGSIQLRVKDEGRGQPILFAHGFPLDHTMWKNQFAALDDKYRLIAPDLRGFGGSTVTGGATSMEQYADDLSGLLDALEVSEKVVFCGLSMGGYIAWQFALKYPQKLKALILCDTRAAADSAEAAAGRRTSAERVLAEGTKFLADTMAKKLFSEKSQQEQPDIVAGQHRAMEAAPRGGTAAALLGMAERPDVTSRLGEIKVPCLLICGSEDVITPAKEMRTVAEKLPHAKYVEVPDVGHMSPLEAPAKVNSAIREFLAGL